MFSDITKGVSSPATVHWTHTFQFFITTTEPLCFSLHKLEHQEKNSSGYNCLCCEETILYFRFRPEKNHMLLILNEMIMVLAI